LFCQCYGELGRHNAHLKAEEQVQIFAYADYDDFCLQSSDLIGFAAFFEVKFSGVNSQNEKIK
jgi:hypothetical protein